MQSTFDALPLPWVEQLFRRMSAFYGSKFSDMWAGARMEDVMQTWAQELSCLTRSELTAGWNALAMREHPPTLPQFVKLCRPAVEPVRAYYEAVSGLQARAAGELGQWSHPAIFWAAAGMAHELRTQSYSQVRERWEAALHAELAKGQWSPLEQPARELAAPVSNRDSITYRQAAAEMQRLVERADEPGFDHKRWARRILERAKRPNHGLNAYAIDMAQTALKNPEDFS